MRQSLIAVLSLVAAFCIQGRATAETPSGINELKKAKVQTARDALHALDEQIKAGRQTASDDIVTIWSKRLLEAELALCERKADRLAAHERHLKYMKQYENLVTEKYTTGSGSILSVAEARYGRLEAELWLAEARTK